MKRARGVASLNREQGDGLGPSGNRSRQGLDRQQGLDKTWTNGT